MNIFLKKVVVVDNFSNFLSLYRCLCMYSIFIYNGINWYWYIICLMEYKIKIIFVDLSGMFYIENEEILGLVEVLKR